MQSAVRLIEQTDEHGHKLLSAGIGKNHIVQRFNQSFERMQVGEQSVESGLQVRHDHSGTHALSFHVGHDRQNRVRSEWNKIVIIAAGLKRWAVRDGNVESVQLRGPLWK